ncbi:hypothetical protein N9995_00065 [bacterium]|jgi:hypothetical protein|nr:hypothetical protein [bacterium]
MVKATQRDGKDAGAGKGSKGGGSFGDVLQKALQQKGPHSGKGRAAPVVGSRAKGNLELKKRIKEEKEAREEAKILVEKRKWFQKEHVIPVRWSLHRAGILVNARLFRSNLDGHMCCRGRTPRRAITKSCSSN